MGFSRRRDPVRLDAYYLPACRSTVRVKSWNRAENSGDGIKNEYGSGSIVKAAVTVGGVGSTGARYFAARSISSG